ncbi:hypothetical protein QBC33DRAFT_612626 [Phialemonium atrogriseum]|uniref:Uncharacterized protein n=1 Tax=Phialemonium atrogriseum TaxID=1093897 RepID=A0AAJ0FFD4_9PEZI|nr:uncharacterized protein QBC33DRAFT_612626 [Phialemonium atrogriseum]KAK1765327.1 hypothetical protein QBC33DRAFT_612626 [Phialemonium atrogriseum]
MDDIHRHFGSHSLWEKYDVAKSPSFDVTELWSSHDGSDSLEAEHRTLSSADLHNWLDELPHKSFHGEAHVRTARLLWVGENPKTWRWGPSTKDLEHILDTWKLQHAVDYARSCFAGVSALPPQDGARCFTVTYHPKLAFAWSYTVSDGRPHMQGVIFAGAEQRGELLDSLECRWSAALAGQPMFPALLCSLVLAGEFDATAAAIKSDVREVEVRTGHHRFSHRQERPAGGELGDLSAKMSGCAAKLANGTRKLKVVEALNEFMLGHSRGGARGDDGGVDAGEMLSHHVRLMKHRLQMQLVDNEYVQQRVQVQIAALFHLIAQQDNAIAFANASSIRSIAQSSQDDSSSMKMLALVAMFFLPGSFVAALFSTSLFDWDGAARSDDRSSIGIGLRPQFGLFWAVTLPLTAVTFGLYTVWIISQRRKRKRKEKRADLKLVTVL